MQKTHIINTITLRFRRWSRNAYAVFFSLGKCVSIGNLKKGIIEASLPKEKAYFFATTSFIEIDNNPEDFDDFDPLLLMMESLNISIFQASSLTKFAETTYNKYDFNNKIAYCFSAC